jgi:hypothetical protein
MMTSFLCIWDTQSKQGEQFAGGRTAKAMLTWVQKKLDPDFKVGDKHPVLMRAHKQ